MDEERTSEALAHLQRAMRELITAARLGLDVLEEILDQVTTLTPRPAGEPGPEAEQERSRVERIRLS